jgi:hypothetical protein
MIDHVLRIPYPPQGPIRNDLRVAWLKLGEPGGKALVWKIDNSRAKYPWWGRNPSGWSSSFDRWQDALEYALKDPATMPKGRTRKVAK